MGFNRGGWESARVSVDSSGRVTIFSGSMSQGHGHVTSLAQVAADVLQVPIEDIDVVQGDTRQVQAGHGTFNSRSMAVGGSSLHVSSTRVVAKAKKIAAGMLEVDEADVSYSAGQFTVPGTDIAPLTFGKVARMAYVGHKLPDGVEPGLDETVFYDPTGMGSPSGVHLAYVEVDPETGIVEIIDYVAVDDVGTLINPLLAAGQIHGGVVQGIAQALYEEVSYDPDNRATPDRLAARLCRAARRARPQHHVAVPGDALPDQSDRRQGHRRKRIDRSAAMHGSCRPRRAFAIRHHAPRHADDAAAHLGGDPNRTHRSKPMIPAAFDYVRASSLAQAIEPAAERSRRQQARCRRPYADPDIEACGWLRRRC